MLRSNIMTSFVAGLAGLLFGAGMIVSAMVDPNKVIGFLNISGDWDPSLALVMGGALAVFSPLYHLLIKKRRVAINGATLVPPASSKIDSNLILGAVFFGAGWGLAGFCPGPAITSISGGSTVVLAFVGCMLIGMFIANRYLAMQRKNSGVVD